MGLDANSKAGTIGKINQKKIRNRSPKFDRQGPHLAASSMMALQPFLAASNPLVSKFNFFFPLLASLNLCSVSYNFV